MSAGASTRGRAARGNLAASAPAKRALSASESAWLAALPCALLTVAAIVVLGPPLGRMLFAPPAGTTIWRAFILSRIAQPEPTEHARYLIALLGPLLLAGCVAWLTGRHMRAKAIPPLRALAQALLLAVVLAGVVAQELHVYSRAYTSEQPASTIRLLTPATLAAAALLGALAAWALSRRSFVARAAAAMRETPAKRAIALGVAVLAVLLWLSSAFNTDATIELANGSVSENIYFWTDEAFSILNGHAPLVDFHAQYGQLWAYVAAGGMKLLGASIGVYSAIMLAGTAGAMTAVYATLRRLAGSSFGALGLFLPCVATSFFVEVGPLANRYSPANLFSLFPIRYAGPYVLLWLVVRRVQRRSSGSAIPLFALAGAVTINNLEFGLPALGATLLALAATAHDRSPRAFARLAAEALAGLAAAAALVCALTLAVAGSLPHFGMLLTFPRIYGAAGFGMLPMPALGLHLAVYVTFAAALVVVAVRLVSAVEDRPLTAALAWAGAFGLGAGTYFAGRSHPHVLVDLFSAWSLTLALLALVAVPAILARPSRRPQLAELLLLAAIGVAICSLPQVPTPWSQIARLEHLPRHGRSADRSVLEVVARLTHRGEAVALLIPLGHRVAYRLGLDDVTPYATMDSMMTVEQWRETIAALRRAHGHQMIVPRPLLFAEREAFLQEAGYMPYRQSPTGVGMIEFVDATLRHGG